jgi:Zn-dependent peptidase ImmA (M78 family)
MPSAGVDTRFRSRDEVEEAAAEVLRRHSLFSVPVDPVVLANREGIKVLNARFSEPELAGMIAKRHGASTILVDQTDPPFRKRFTIAHELGHHFLHLTGDEGEFVDSERDLFRSTEFQGEEMTARRPEIQANWFAAALLMPAQFVRAEFAKTRDLDALAERFNVSAAAMGYRLETLGLD